MCLSKILRAIDIRTAGRKEIEAFIADLNKSDYRAWTKHAYRLTMEKLFQYLSNGNTSKETPFPEEVYHGSSYASQRPRYRGTLELARTSFYRLMISLRF